MHSLTESVNNFVRLMRKTTKKQKVDVEENLKKMSKMQELQQSSIYLTDACELYSNRIRDARNRHLLPKTIIEMMNDTRIGESCNFENFASRESVEELNERIRKDRVFLM